MEEWANRYTPEWQRLTEILRYVMRAGLNEQDAKADLCNAIADGAVAVRVRVAGNASIGVGQVFGPTLVVVPSHLDPVDLDWDRSRPLMPWAIRRTVAQEYMGGGSGDGRPIALLKLCTEDVKRIWADTSHPTRRGSNEAPPVAAASPPTPHDVRPKPSDRQVRRWFKERVASWPDNLRAPTEMEDWTAVRQHFGAAISRTDEFRLVRRQETPTEWRKQGPRRLWGQVKPSARQSANSTTCQSANLPRQN